MGRDIIVAVFPSRKALVRALEHMEEHTLVDIRQAAVVARAKNGKTVVLDDDLSPDEGGRTGSIAGAVLTLVALWLLGVAALPTLALSVVLLSGAIGGALLGGMIGRFTASLLPSGFPQEILTSFVDQLPTGHPALVLMLRETESSLNVLRDELSAFQAESIEPLQQLSFKQPPSAS